MRNGMIRFITTTEYHSEISAFILFLEKYSRGKKGNTPRHIGARICTMLKYIGHQKFVILVSEVI